jgi:hypothetical protein
MGLKGYRLWVMGQLDSNVQSPTAPSVIFFMSPVGYTAAVVAAARVHAASNLTDWTETKQSHASLVHDTGLTNGLHAKRHTALPASTAL